MEKVLVGNEEWDLIDSYSRAQAIQKEMNG